MPKGNLTPEENAQAQALGRTRGSYGTKAHALADACGRTIAFVLTPNRRLAGLPTRDAALGRG